MAKAARLLMVDDEENVAVTLRAVLEREGYLVWTAASASEVDALVDQQEFDAAIVDLKLGDDDGIDVLKRLRTRQPDCVAIMLTGYASVESAIAAIRQGAYDYLTKPTDLDQLKMTVLGAVERSAISRALRERERKSGSKKTGTLAQELQHSLEQVTVEGVLVRDITGKSVYANDSAANILGHPSPQALLDASTTELLAKVDLLDEAGKPFPTAGLPWGMALKGMQSPSVVLRLRVRATGEERAAMVKTAPVFDERGRVQFEISSFTDITERVRAVVGLRLLAETGELLASSLEHDVTLQRVLGLVVPALADWCSISLMDGEGQVARLVVHHADPAKTEVLQEFLRRLAAQTDNGRQGVLQLLHTDQLQIYPDVSSTQLEAFSHSPEDLSLLQEVGLKSMMVLPLEVEGRTLGSLTLVAVKPGRRYDAQDLVLAQELARRCALAVETGRLHAAEQAAREQAEAAQHRLAAQYEISQVLMQAPSFETAAPGLLQAVGENLGWDFGSLWLMEPRTGLLRCSHLWHPPSVTADEFEAVTRQTAFRPKEGFPGRVWADGGPAWISDILQESALVRRDAAVQAGFQTAIFFPIQSEGKTLGIMEFFSRQRRAYSEDLLQAMVVAGNHIGQFIERKQVEALVLQLSTPVLQIRERLLLLPIIGVIDAERARHLTDRLLSAIRENRAKVVVIDVTGVALMDSYIANHLLRAMEAARLLGTTVIITGISPDVTQALLRLGLDLTRLNTVGDLQSGIEEAERLMADNPQARSKIV